MATKSKSQDSLKNSTNRKRKAAYSALAKSDSASAKRARLKAARAVRVVGTYVLHPHSPCGNPACMRCYDTNSVVWREKQRRLGRA